MAEGFPTLVTSVGPLSGVDRLVLGGRGGVTEGLATLAAFVGLLPRVDFLVAGEVGHLRVKLPTPVAFIGLLPSMASLVFNEGGALGEGLSAIRAPVWLSPGWIRRCSERRALREGLAARAERLPAVLAPVGSLPRVSSLVQDIV